MSEIKTFGELSLSDKIFFVSDDYFHTLTFNRIENDDEQICKTKFTFIQIEDTVSLPDDECTFIDKENNLKYTTDPKQYKEWLTPFINKQIAEKEKRIEAIKLEIAELKESIG